MEQIQAFLESQRLYELATGVGRFFLILLVAYLAARVASRIIRGLHAQIVGAMSRSGGGTAGELEKRATTIVSIGRKTVVVTIWIMALVMALRELGFDVGPLLAGAGVLGLAVGFGAQNLVRDVITGMFMLLENQIRTGDVAVLNGTGGLVEEVNLRTTILRSLDGTVHVFPNGTINTLANKTREFSYYVFDMGVAYKEDTDRVAEVLRQVGDELMDEPRFAADLLAPIEVFGVDRFDDSAVIIKGRLKTAPSKQWDVGREFNRRVKKRFDELGIEIPFPHQSLYFGEASQPFQLAFDPAAREEIRQIVREVLEKGS